MQVVAGVRQLALLAERHDIGHSAVRGEERRAEQEGAGLGGCNGRCGHVPADLADQLGEDLLVLHKRHYVNEIDSFLREVLIEFQCLFKHGC